MQLLLSVFLQNNVPTNDIDDIKIGKFGVGFKAVFQYTTTPSIYDKPFCFKIEDYIVPTKLNDTTLQREGKTVFVIPFNRKDIDAQQAYEDIEQKISSLDYPQLFLRNMQTISWNTPTQRGKIVKQLLENMILIATLRLPFMSLTAQEVHKTKYYCCQEM